MRIPRPWVAHIARRVADKLVGEGFVEIDMPVGEFTGIVETLITEELMVEDRLNDEVRVILKQYESDIDRGRLDYRTLFDLTKRKLIRDRDIIV